MSEPELIVLGIVLAALCALFYRDFWIARKQRRIRQKKRYDARRIGKVRTRVWSNLMSLRRTRQLTYQHRPDVQDGPER